MFAMLTASERTFTNRQGRDCKSFEEGMDLLRSRYSSADKQRRLLTEWNNMSLTKEMEERPDGSQMEVFRKFAERLMGLQHQLQRDYHPDRYLRDRLMSAVDILYIQHALRDRTPRTSHQLRKGRQQAVHKTRIIISGGACSPT